MIDLSHPLPGGRLALPQVTLCAVTSVNVAATVRALDACLEQIDFASCRLFTSAPVKLRPEIEVMPIARIASSRAYSEFVLSRLADYIETSHCLIVQWDGYVLDAQRWHPDFLHYDYIGASWPQFSDDHNVGNGGFSLRSCRLMRACQEPEFDHGHPEAFAIGRTNRRWLESMGMRFAPRALADKFAAERAGDPRTSFGFHGVFNMPRAIGAEEFWRVYLGLDDRNTVDRDFGRILRDVGRGAVGAGRVFRMIADRTRKIWRNR